MKKKIIYGCESRGDSQSPYLTRYTLLDKPWLQVCLHVFHRSDADELHDHPWNFVSVILWRGYREHTFNGPFLKSSRKWPGMVLFRKAKHAHRVELIKGKQAVTLVFMSKRVRDWGFFTESGWKIWTKYFNDNKC